MQFVYLGWALATALAIALVLVLALRKKCPAVAAATKCPARKCAPPCLGLRYMPPADATTADLLRSAQALLASSTKASCRVAKELWATWRAPLVAMMGESREAMCSAAERAKVVARMRAQAEEGLEGLSYRLTADEIDDAVTAVTDLLNAAANAACRKGRASGAAVASTVDNLIAAFCF